MGSSGKMEAVGGTQLDPASQRRQDHLFSQAEQYAATRPFQQQYGPASAMPGMSAMSQAGQQYTANQILGPGASQNLGFQDYQRPGSGWGYQPQPQQPAYRPQPQPPFRPPTGGPQGPVIGSGPGGYQGPGGDPEGPEGGGGENVIGGPGGLGPGIGPISGGGPEGQPGDGSRPWSGGPGQSAPPGLGTQRIEGYPAPKPEDLIPMGGMGGPSGQFPRKPIREEAMYDMVSPEGPRGIQEALPQSIGFPGGAPRPQYQPPRPPQEEFLPVGIGEVREAQEATRGLLGQPRPEDITAERIDAPDIGETTVDTVSDIEAAEIGGPEAIDVGTVDAPELAGTDEVSITDIAARDVAGPEEITIDPVTGQTTEAMDAVTAREIAAPGEVTVDPVTGETTEAIDAVTAREIATPSEVTIDPVTGQTTEAVDAVTPDKFEAASFLGGPAIEDYMNKAGVDAQVAQAEEDYQRQLNQLQAQQAGSGAFGARAQLQDLGAMESAQRNLAQIRGAGFDRAAALKAQDIQSQVQEQMQRQQLGTQAGLAGQGLEAQRREADAARAQQAAMAGQQLGAQAGMQTQQLEQQAGIRGAELGVQTGLAGQQLEAQRREADAARAQQAAMQGQQLGFQGQLQTQQLAQAGDIRGAELGLQAGMQGQQLEAQRRESDAARAQQAAMAGQQLGVQADMQTQQLQQQAGMQNAQNALAAAEANQQAALATGTQAQQLEAQRQTEAARMQLGAAQQTQELGARAGMQTQQQQTQVAMQNAQNQMEAARANQAAAMQRGDQQAAIDAQRQMGQAQMGLDAATRNQAAALQAAELTQRGGQQFGDQQLAAASQLGRLGGAEQQMAFGAGRELQAMGAAQEEAQRRQQAFDYEQWLRGQEGGARELSLLQGMMPTAQTQQMQRKQGLGSQIFGGLLSAGGIASQFMGSDSRLKDNVASVGTQNGFNLYDFNYKGDDIRYRGVMAQEVMKQRPDAVRMRNGFYEVNYGTIGIPFQRIG